MAEQSGALALVYEGTPIRRRGLMWCLTDMWRAAGADPNKQPAQWLRLPSTAGFAEHLAADMGKSHNELYQTLRGGNTEQGTWGHRQLALSYARYLSPPFHQWCNERLIDVMEGRHGGGALVAVERHLARTAAMLEGLATSHVALAQDVGEVKTGLRLVHSRVEEQGQEIRAQGQEIRRLAEQVSRPSKRPIPDWVPQRHAQAKHILRDPLCMVCRDRPVIDGHGERLPGTHADHWQAQDAVCVASTALLCGPCNQDFNTGRRVRQNYQAVYSGFIEQVRNKAPHLLVPPAARGKPRDKRIHDERQVPMPLQARA